MRVKAHLFQTGDTFNLGDGGPVYRVDTIAPADDIPGLIIIGFTDTSDSGSGARVGFPADNDLNAVAMPRVVAVQCMLCKDEYPHDIDLTDGTTVHGGICGVCNARTTAQVLAEQAKTGDN